MPLPPSALSGLQYSARLWIESSHLVKEIDCVLGYVSPQTHYLVDGLTDIYSQLPAEAFTELYELKSLEKKDLSGTSHSCYSVLSGFSVWLYQGQ